jgi:hypothetical protein
VGELVRKDGSKFGPCEHGKQREADDECSLAAAAGHHSAAGEVGHSDLGRGACAHPPRNVCHLGAKTRGVERGDHGSEVRVGVRAVDAGPGTAERGHNGMEVAQAEIVGEPAPQHGNKSATDEKCQRAQGGTQGIDDLNRVEGQVVRQQSDALGWRRLGVIDRVRALGRRTCAVESGFLGVRRMEYPLVGVGRRQVSEPRG